MPRTQSHPPEHAAKWPHAQPPVPRLRPLSPQGTTPPASASESAGKAARHHHTHSHVQHSSHGALVSHLSKVEMTRFETVDFMAEVDTHDTIEVELRPTDLSSPAQVIRLKASETVQNVKKKILSTPGVTFGYSDFDLVFNGRNMLDPLSLTDIPGIVTQPRPVVQVAFRSGMPLALPPMETTCLGSLIEVVGSGTPRTDAVVVHESQPASCGAASVGHNTASSGSAAGAFATNPGSPLCPAIEVVQLSSRGQNPGHGVSTPPELGCAISHPDDPVGTSDSTNVLPMSRLSSCSDSPFVAAPSQERPRSASPFTHSSSSAHCPVPHLSLPSSVATHSLVSSPQSNESAASSERTQYSDFGSSGQIEPVHSSRSVEESSSRQLEGDVTLFSSACPGLPSISLSPSGPTKVQQSCSHEQRPLSVQGQSNATSCDARESQGLAVPHLPETVIQQYAKEHEELQETIERMQSIISELQRTVDVVKQCGQHEQAPSQEKAFSVLQHNEATLAKLRDDVLKAREQLEKTESIIKLQSEELSVVERRITSLQDTNQALKNHWEQCRVLSSDCSSISSF